MAENMVKFLMPDGTEVSNDSRFDLDEALAKSINSRPTTGSVGPTWDEQQAQIMATRLAELNSTQQGVGENATVDDPTALVHGTTGPPAWTANPEAAKQAQEAGGSPQSTTNDDLEPIDSNEAVMAVREQLKKDQEAYAKAVDKLGDDGPGDPNVPLEDWSAKQLVAEIHRRNADETRSEEERIELEKNTKANAVEALKADNDRIAAATANAGQE